MPAQDRSPALTIQRVEGGFPHSEILGSKLVRSSPRLIAAYHVLHRLSAPRHPPDALTTLDYSHDQCPLGKDRTKIVKKDLSSDFHPKTYFCLPSISGANGCGPSLVRGTRKSARRRCCLFTISNIRAHPHRGEANTFDIQNTSKNWWSLSGSNRRPEACKATALPAELRPPWRSFCFGLRRRRKRPLSWLSRASARAAVRPSQESGAGPTRQRRKPDRAPPTSRRTAKATDVAAGA